MLVTFTGRRRYVATEGQGALKEYAFEV